MKMITDALKHVLSINLQPRHNLVEKRWDQDWQVQRVDQC